MAITIGPDTNRYFTDQSSLQVLDGVVAYADDVNALTQKCNTAFDLIESEIDGLLSNQSTANQWATADQGVLPEPTATMYSARAYAIEAKSWAEEGAGFGIKLADGTVDTASESAKTHASNAATSESNAATSASNAATSASNASTSEANAASSANSAATSATDAANSATAASNSATDAANSATAASNSATAAATSEANAATSESNAATSASSAATSENNAANSAASASSSASSAATSASNAATSETNAATSETNAATSASNAATSETNAANSATSASSSASAAATSETNAANSETAAANSAIESYNWANTPEDTYVPGTTEYSAYHWAQKAVQSTVGKLEAMTISVTVTVGTGGNYLTLTDALDYLYNLYRSTYKSTPVRAYVNILSGTTISDQIVLEDVDMSWITIQAEDAQVPVDGSSWSAVDYPFIGVLVKPFIELRGASSPIVDCGINLLTADSTVFVANKGSKVNIKNRTVTVATAGFAFLNNSSQLFAADGLTINKTLSSAGIVSQIAKATSNSAIMFSNVTCSADGYNSSVTLESGSFLETSNCTLNPGVSLGRNCVWNGSSDSVSGDITASRGSRVYTPAVSITNGRFSFNNTTTIIESISYTETDGIVRTLFDVYGGELDCVIDAVSVTTNLDWILKASSNAKVKLASNVGGTFANNGVSCLDGCNFLGSFAGLTVLSKLFISLNSTFKVTSSADLISSGVGMTSADTVCSFENSTVDIPGLTITCNGAPKVLTAVRCTIDLTSAILTGYSEDITVDLKYSMVSATSCIIKHLNTSLGSRTLNCSTVTGSFSGSNISATVGQAVYAISGSSVIFSNASISTADANAYSAVYALQSVVAVSSATISGGERGVAAFGSSTVHAYASNVSGTSIYAYAVSGGGKIAMNGAVGQTTTNIAVNTLSSAGIIFA